jgi:hypothetical protein
MSSLSYGLTACAGRGRGKNLVTVETTSPVNEIFIINNQILTKEMEKESVKI